MRYNTHHIIYGEKAIGKMPTIDGLDPIDDGECQCCGHIFEDDWTVDIPAFLHQHLNIIQRWKPSFERYALLTAFVHAISFEWNKMRCELDRVEERENKE